MIRRIITILLISTVLVGKAQTVDVDTVGLTAEKCFSAAQTIEFSLLETNTRLDMLDYFHAGISKPSQNATGGDCLIEDETTYCISWTGGKDTRYQLFVLAPLSPSPIIGIVETVDTPVPDSQIRFYDSRWQELSEDIFIEPKLADWLQGLSKDQILVATDRLPFVLYSINYDEDNQSLTLNNNMATYFHPSDTPDIVNEMRQQLTYVWDGKRFKLQKK